MTERFVWSLGDASIEFLNGSMQYFEEDQPASSIQDVMYFYYDVVIKVGRRTLRFDTHDFPKVQNLSIYIQEIMNHDTENIGYLLDHTTTEYGFYRKIRYHQIELHDMFWNEYFVRIEKYCYEVKQADEETAKTWTEYKLTIGEIPQNSKSESCVAWFINGVDGEALKRLSETADRFVEYSIKQNNEWLNERKMNPINDGE